MKHDFKTMAKSLNIDLNEKQLKQFELYYQLLIEWNSKMNLTTIVDRDEVYEKHFIDSLCFTKAVSLTNQSILDVGSGAGFPSIPLKIVFPELKITIVDALKKRITFLETLSKHLNLDITLHHERIEDFGKENQYSIVTARAVASLNVLAELCIPFVKTSGVFIAMKTKNYNEEVQQALNAIATLGGKIQDTLEYKYLNNDRSLIVVKKINKTPDIYPRKFNKIKKSPL